MAKKTIATYGRKFVYDDKDKFFWNNRGYYWSTSVSVDLTARLWSAFAKARKPISVAEAMDRANIRKKRASQDHVYAADYLARARGMADRGMLRVVERA